LVVVFTVKPEGQRMARRGRQATDLHPGHTVGDAFQVVARAYGLALQRHCSAVQRHSDPETIHGTRITIRRLLTAISALTPTADDPARSAIKSKLHRLQKTLNGVRDADTWLEILAENANGLTAKDLACLRKTVLAVRAHELAACRKLCRSRTYRAIGREIAAWVSGGTWRSKSSLMPVTTYAGHYLAHLDRKIRKRTKSISRLDEAATHKLRISVKKVRYAAELFAPLYKNAASKKLKRYSEAMERLQGALGALTDLASHQRIAKNIFVRDKLSRNPALPFAAGIVLGQELGARAKTMKAARKACKEYRKTTPPLI
jgi:CHAD domain-containing protein